MSNNITLKQAVAQAALQYIKPGTIVGVGTGSTVDCFIDALATSGIALIGAVSSSERSSQRLLQLGIRVLDLNNVLRQANTPHGLSVYVDGADEIDPQFAMIKGGGGALTQEKIVAEASATFVCIADVSKEVSVLGKFPLPVEVLPMAHVLVARRLAQIGGQAKHREGFITDNGNIILDVHNLDITDAATLESTINQWPGVVSNGLFARRPADIALIASATGVQRRQRVAKMS